MNDLEVSTRTYCSDHARSRISSGKDSFLQCDREVVAETVLLEISNDQSPCLSAISLSCDHLRRVSLVACVFRSSLLAPFAWTASIAILVSVTAPLSAREIRVGVLIDGPTAREGISSDALERAAAETYGDGLTLTIAPQSRLDGHWNASTLNAAIDRLESDPLWYRVRSGAARA
jgi:hypothetical protein